MAEKVRRRRRRAVLVPLLGLGVAAWVVRQRMTERHGPDTGWQPLPPRPVVPPVASVRAAHASPDVADLRTPASAEPETPVEPAADAVEVPADALRTAVEPAAESAAASTEVAAESAAGVTDRPRARAVATANAVASVAAPALPDTPFGPGSL